MNRSLSTISIIVLVTFCILYHHGIIIIERESVYPKVEELKYGHLNVRFSEETASRINDQFNTLIEDHVSLENDLNFEHCANEWLEMKDSQFIALDDSGRLFVYSVYLDEYFDEDHYYTLRAFIFKKNDYKARIVASLDNVTEVESSKITRTGRGMHIYNKASDMVDWWGYLATFVFQKSSARSSHVPCSLRVGTGESRMRVTVPIRRTMKVDDQKFVLCMKPIYHGENFEISQFLQFLAINRALGVDRVILYLSDELPVYLKRFLIQEADYVKLVKFNLPNNNTYCRAQHLAVNECIFRQMPHAKYLSLHDLDEVIIPNAPHESLAEILHRHFEEENSGAGAICFHNVYYPDYFFEKTPSNGANIYPMFGITKRCRYLDPIQTKCIIRPELIRHMDVHKPLYNLYGSFVWSYTSYSRNKAFSRHYRNPPTKYCDLFNHLDHVEDDSIFRFVPQNMTHVFDEKIEAFIN